MDNNLYEYSLKMKNSSLRQMMREDTGRFKKFSFEVGEVLFDFSKNFIDSEILHHLAAGAESLELRAKMEDMFSGKIINNTEGRAVLHTALRNFSGNPVFVSGEDVMPKIEAVREKMKRFADGVNSGALLSATGKKFTDVVNIGIGGSDLGPKTVAKALTPYSLGLHVHYVSNVDSSDIFETLEKVNPETTLFIIASKTFTTMETMRNAETAKARFLGSGRSQSDVAKHFVALSTNLEATSKFGINPENVFEFWNWVGGRYSVWSAIGLSVAIYIGWDNFEKFLRGGFEMDKHFRTAPFEKNVPVIAALIGAFYNEYFGAETEAVIPYEHYLEDFPAFLQQLNMESNGKSVTKYGKITSKKTGQVIWGEPGTNAQHSFFQLLHQGMRFIPVDFIGGAEAAHPIENHHEMLLANMFAQSEALMNGKSAEAVREEMLAAKMPEDKVKLLIPHRTFAGNRPSTVILYRKLTPETMGILTAYYEHKVFTQGVLWGLNSFDQWGVELGKQLAGKILPELTGEKSGGMHDSSTAGLIAYFQKYSKEKQTK